MRHQSNYAQKSQTDLKGLTKNLDYGLGGSADGPESIEGCLNQLQTPPQISSLN